MNTSVEPVVDLFWVVRTLRKRALLVLGVLLICIAAFASLAFLSERIYRASTILSATDRGQGGRGLDSMLGQFSGLASLAGIRVSDKEENTEEALAVLRSRRFSESFFQEANVLPTLFAAKWDAQRAQWRSGRPPSASQAYRYFDRHVRRVIQNKKTGLITLEIDWSDPQLAAKWANLLVGKLNAEMRSRAIAEANTSLSYLEHELAATDVLEVRQAINRLMEAQIKQRMLANVNQEFTFRVVDAAIAPEPDDYVRPNKLVLLLVGCLLGVVLGVLAALGMEHLAIGRSRSRGEHPAAAPAYSSRG